MFLLRSKKAHCRQESLSNERYIVSTGCTSVLATPVPLAVFKAYFLREAFVTEQGVWSGFAPTKAFKDCHWVDSSTKS